jgi:membrane fusion protein (multidrug efflux system)
LNLIHTSVAVVGIVTASALAWWWQQRPAAAPVAAAQPVAARAGPAAPGGPAVVEVARASTMRIDDEASAPGSLQARQAVTIRPEVSGRIVALGFVDGQPVRKGQVLLQLDDRLQAAQLQQALAQAAIARTNLQRQRELLAEGFVSASAVDQTQAALDVAEAQVALARAQLERLRVVAPFAGRAGIRRVAVGDYVKDGADVVDVEDSAELWLDYRLPERYVGRVRVGQPVEVRLDALPQRLLQARVEALDVQLDADGRALRVRARLANPGGVLRSGMFARTRTVFATRAQAVVVPEAALVPLGERQYVFKVVDAEGGGQRTQRVPAEIGLRLPGQVELLAGVAAGDRVVTAGHARIAREASVPVRVIDLDAAAPAPGSGGAAPRRNGSAG